MAACGIDLILNAEVSGTTSTLIGSARIVTGSNTYVAFRGMFGPSTTATASIEVKRFTGGSIGLQDISASGATIASFGIVNDWYDFYASGSGASVSSLIKGIKVTLY